MYVNRYSYNIIYISLYIHDFSAGLPVPFLLPNQHLAGRVGAPSKNEDVKWPQVASSFHQTKSGKCIQNVSNNVSKKCIYPKMYPKCLNMSCLQKMFLQISHDILLTKLHLQNVWHHLSWNTSAEKSGLTFPLPQKRNSSYHFQPSQRNKFGLKKAARHASMS